MMAVVAGCGNDNGKKGAITSSGAADEVYVAPGEHDEFYEQCADAYMKVFDRLGLGGITYRTFASGGSFSKYSDEFQTLSPVGEDTIYVHEGKGIAINQEVYNDEVLADLGITKEELVEKTAVEVGNIFTLGTKYSDALGLEYTDEKGEKTSVFMGSYGIGPSRVMGLIAEHFADEKGLVWPLNVSPYHIYLVTIGDVADRAEQLIADLEAAGVEVLYDDRDERPGAKFADAELMGIPYRVVLSERTLAEEQVELTERRSGKTEMVSQSAIVSNITSKIS